ncbi:MAG: hypothetical protein J3K34DRAFT_205940 [Monoraphidium minutum]|nr:MAG: hypothetical protein J3K34DRAFT_205940 [Monoraphidium minutum]
MQSQQLHTRPPGRPAARPPAAAQQQRARRAPARVLCSGASGGALPSGSSDEPAPRATPGSVVYRGKQGGSLKQPAFPLAVPLLPFPADDVLVPGGTKILHLYEARYLSLLERALKADPPVFCHVAVEQPIDPGSSTTARLPGALVGGDFALALATLVQVVEVKAQGVGALVRVQAEGRAAVESLKQLQPYIAGAVSPLLDDPVPAGGVDAALRSADELEAMLRECADMCARFGGTEAAALQQATLWAERRPLMPSLPAGPHADALERANRLAWAALSPMPQASESELRQLLRYRLAAMAATSLPDRLQLARASLEAARGMLSARIALKSLNIGAP